MGENRREPDGPGAAGPRAGPGESGHHRGPARRQARRLGAGRAALRRHPPRGRHPDRLRPRAVRRLPGRTRPPAPTADVQRHRGARPGHGRARRSPRRERPHEPGGRRARQARAGAPGAGGRPGRGGPSYDGGCARPRRRPARPRDHRRPGPGLLRPATGAARLPVRGGVGVARRRRPVGGRRTPRAVVPAVPHPSQGCPAGLPGRPGPGRGAARRHVQAARRPRPGRPARGASRGRLGVRRRGRARRARRRRGALRPAHPRPARAGRCGDLAPGRQHQRPVVVRQQLAAVPATYRILRCPELREAAHAIGQRLLAAADGPAPPSPRAPRSLRG